MNIIETVYRYYRPGDETAIADLFIETFNSIYSIKDWVWQYQKTPSGKYYFSLAYSSDKLVGSTAGLLFHLSLFGKEIDAIRIQHLMIESASRNQGIGNQILINLFSLSAKNHCNIAFTFPNNQRNSLRRFLALDFNLIGFLHTYFLPVEKIQLSEDKNTNGNITDIPNFNVDDIKFINLTLNRYSIYLKRSPLYLNWRYSKGSGKKYYILRLYKSNQLTGIIVYKLFEKNHSIDILELFLESYTIQNIQNVVSIISSENKIMNISGFNIWSNSHYLYHESILQMGFKQTTLLTNVMLKDFSKDNVMKGDDNFYFSFGDSDIY